MLAVLLSNTLLSLVVAASDACPSPVTLAELTKCKGKPTKVVPSKDKNFEFVYYEQSATFEEYIYDRKEKKICGSSVVREMKTSSDEASCFKCKNGIC